MRENSTTCGVSSRWGRARIKAGDRKFSFMSSGGLRLCWPENHPALLHVLQLASKTGTTLSGITKISLLRYWTGHCSPSETGSHDVAASVLTSAAKVSGTHHLTFGRWSPSWIVWRIVEEHRGSGWEPSSCHSMRYCCVLLQPNGSGANLSPLLAYWSQYSIHQTRRPGRSETTLWQTSCHRR